MGEDTAERGELGVQKGYPMPYNMLSSKNSGKGGRAKYAFGLQHFCPQLLVTCTEALLSRRRPDISLPMGSSEWIPYFALLSCAALFHFLNCFLS